MITTRRKCLCFVMLTISLTVVIGELSRPALAQVQTELSEEQATEIAADAYIFGYPLVTLEMTRRVLTNTAVAEATRAPMGQFNHIRRYPPLTYRAVPGANADALYSSAWLDLSKEPYILSAPEAEGRYFMLPMLNGWSDVIHAPGSRTTGGEPQTYAITGPNWKSELPSGVTQYKSDTNLIWILGRTYCSGTAQDYEKVNSFQDQLVLVPLSAYGKDYTPPMGNVDPTIDLKTTTKDQVIGMDAAAYFKLLASLMSANPPTAADSALVSRMAMIGLVPGKAWDIGTLDPTIANGVMKAPAAALAKMLAHEPNAGKIVNGWVITSPAGVYGTDYLQRAVLNYQGPGWNQAADAVYPSAKVDSEGKALSGANKYVVRFPKGQLPPVKGFWSLTLYDLEGFFVMNPLDRVNLSQRDTFNFNDDGSLDLYIQHESPGTDREANWLPAPIGEFHLFMRLYWPSDKAPTILDGSWQPPEIRRVM